MNGTMIYEYITILFKTEQIDVKVKFYHRLNVEENKTHKNFIKLYLWDTFNKRKLIILLDWQKSVNYSGLKKTP